MMIKNVCVMNAHVYISKFKLLNREVTFAKELYACPFRLL